jgi:hypothetical protein
MRIRCSSNDFTRPFAWQGDGIHAQTHRLMGGTQHFIEGKGSEFQNADLFLDAIMIKVFFQSVDLSDIKSPLK